MAWPVQGKNWSGSSYFIDNKRHFQALCLSRLHTASLTLCVVSAAVTHGCSDCIVQYAKYISHLNCVVWICSATTPLSGWRPLPQYFLKHVLLAMIASPASQMSTHFFFKFNLLFVFLLHTETKNTLGCAHKDGIYVKMWLKRWIGPIVNCDVEENNHVNKRKSKQLSPQCPWDYIALTTALLYLNILWISHW